MPEIVERYLADENVDRVAWDFDLPLARRIRFTGRGAATSDGTCEGSDASRFDTIQK